MMRRVKRDEQLRLRLGQTRAATGDYIADSGAGYGDGVHVAFDENREIALAQRFFGAVEMVENATFGINRRFGRVHVLRHVIAHGAAAEGDHFAGFIRDGEHDAAAKTIVEAVAILVARDDAGNFQKFFGIFLLQKTE